MVATQTVHQLQHSRNPSKITPVTQTANMTECLSPRHGVVTLFGYGTNVRVDRGHLVLEDGIGPVRRRARFPRVGHGLRRLVVIGSDGIVSLSALSWLADQNAALVMLDRDGSVLLTTGPVRPSDARLRRAQALAYESGMALRIARELIARKLAGQEQVVRDKLRDANAAQAIADAQLRLAEVESHEGLADAERQGALAYWSAWRSIPVMYPRNDLRRVPRHWLTFGTRRSPLTGSPRLAVNPLNAILNYLYAVLESEARLALAALGLDPGLGVMHVDSRTRDSLACDLMEPIRPQVDAYLLDWIAREPLRREWFFEQRDGNCRLMGSFAVRLSETATTWGRAIAPIAEWVARTLWSAISKPDRRRLATRLTQGHRREAKGSAPDLPNRPAPRPAAVCHLCGASAAQGSVHCRSCAVKVRKERFVEVVKLGRIATHSPKAETLRSQTRRRHAAALKAWKPSDKPDWLDEKTYREKIQPRLARFPVSAISSALLVSHPYATDIRAGRRQPHPRHWLALARLVRVLSDEPGT
jgi:CRISPR-associated endonuclease Cas1